MTTRSERSTLIDGLRGFAALSVAFHHIYLRSPLLLTLEGMLPWWFNPYVLQPGGVGVEIFFVISGYVIAYSLRNTRIDARATSRFILRRQIRLDPPYWVCLVGYFAVDTVHAIAKHEPRPALGLIPVNALYLQGILEKPWIVPVAWTLCLEIQFYLLFIVLSALIQRASPRLGRQATVVLVMAPLFAVSVWLRAGTSVYEPWLEPWFIHSWHLFALGSIVFYFTEGSLSGWWVALAIASVAFAGIHGHNAGPVIGAVTAASIAIAWRRGGLNTWLRWKPLQRLGAISYSIYLVHMEVGTRVMKLGYALTGTNRVAAILWFWVAVAACIAAAEVLNRVVEEPSRKLASSLGRKKSEAALAPPLAAPIAGDGSS